MVCGRRQYCYSTEETNMWIKNSIIIHLPVIRFLLLALKLSRVGLNLKCKFTGNQQRLAKDSSLKTMFNHVYALSSTAKAFNLECNKLCSIFSYPRILIDSTINLLCNVSEQIVEEKRLTVLCEMKWMVLCKMVLCETLLCEMVLRKVSSTFHK